MTKRIPHIVSFLVVVLAIASPLAVAQPLVDKVPDEAFLYVGWRGADSMPSAFANSHFKAFLDSSNVPAVLHDTLPKVMAMAAKKGGPDAARGVRLLETLLSPMWKYPTAVYLGVDLSGGQPMPKGAIICQAGANAPAIKQTIDELMTGAQMPPFPVRTFVEGDIVGIAIGYDEGASALVGGEGNKSKSLGASTAFQNAIARVGATEPMFVAHVDIERLLQLADQGVEMSRDPQLAERWPKIREATGMAGLRRMLMCAGFDGQDWAARAFVEAPSPRKGLLALGDTAPLDDATLKLVPATATSFAAGPFDPAKLITTIREIAGEVDPQAGQIVDQGLGAVQMYVGKNLVKDILEPLGEQWVVYNDPNVAGFGFGGAVVVNKLDDPVKANQGLGALAIAINNTLAGALKNEDVRVSIRYTKVGDLTINYIAVPVIAPAWAIKDGKLFIGLYPQVVANAVRRAGEADASKSILDNADFQAMRKRLGVERPTSISYANQREGVLQNYQLTMLMTRGLIGAADLIGVDAPEFVLPPLNELQKHLGFSGSVGWADDGGFYMKHVSPFPGSEVLSGEVSPLIALAPMGMVAGAVGNAQQPRNLQGPVGIRGGQQTALASQHPVRDACAAHLREIGKACHQFASAHNGSFPNDLADLALQFAERGERRGDLFLCPAHKRGSTTAQLNADAFGKWVTENTDYIYVAEGVTMTAPPKTLIAYEKPDAHAGNGMNMLFLDGHIEFHSMADAQRIIAEQKK